MDYDTVINLDTVTLGDCLALYERKNTTTIINDGRVINFEEGDIYA